MSVKFFIEGILWGWYCYCWTVSTHAHKQTHLHSLWTSTSLSPYGPSVSIVTRWRGGGGGSVNRVEKGERVCVEREREHAQAETCRRCSLAAASWRKRRSWGALEICREWEKGRQKLVVRRRGVKLGKRGEEEKKKRRKSHLSWTARTQQRRVWEKKNTGRQRRANWTRLSFGISPVLSRGRWPGWETGQGMSDEEKEGYLLKTRKSRGGRERKETRISPWSFCILLAVLFMHLLSLCPARRLQRTKRFHGAQSTLLTRLIYWLCVCGSWT